MATVEKEGKKAVEMVQDLANGGEQQEASADLRLCFRLNLRQFF